MSTKSSKDNKIKVKTHSQDSIPSFIRKTYDILEERKFPDIIDWNPEGTALVIKKPTEFCQKVLPAYFKHNNLTSFVRQLNMYNFHKRRTQNVDHVYYHELFQRGKKQLLKEIRRKSQNGGVSSDPSERILKIEAADTPQYPEKENSLSEENQLLKRLYNDAMAKLSLLENRVQEMSAENHNLLNQLYFQQRGAEENHNLTLARKQSSLTQDQLPMTFSGINIPPLKINAHRQHTIQGAMPIVKGHSIGRFFTPEEMGESTATEVSQRDSPSVRQRTESDKACDGQEGALALQLPQFTLAPQVSQIQALKAYNDLGISRSEMSVGQLFEAWNSENFNNSNIDAEKLGLLGKRQLDLGNTDAKFQVPEPPMKRHELSIWNRRSIISTGLEDMRSLLRRDSSVGEEFDHNAGVDLMDFNHPFFAYTKNT